MSDHHHHHHGHDCGHSHEGNAYTQNLHEVSLTSSRSLHYAAKSGPPTHLHALLQKGKRVDERDTSGYTPLLHAARSGHIDVISVLVEAGADVNAHTPEMRSTVLHRLSIHRDATGMVEVLIRRGADVCAQDGDGETALHKACSVSENEKTVELLYEKMTKKGGPDLRNRKGESAQEVYNRYMKC
ncbi:ankyrin [Saitoella complicata NRRL Y-17804]|uniref:ankyrin n=1 Tax=Saitoella complicata (strain BCRC 22490 / CBS 7301 / JCM 7358 / NBRC 10748 / NRRL Y-17804) TaxID=698492 RepID=UPI000867FAD7|nr:ankyrin [Saitoella complicata NRRL Y-17804]ODQ53028.1 ankyrin [Saitoella complicata NRRL Y-17804]